MSATQELERGRLAREVMENPVFQDAAAQVEEGITREWQNETDPKRREWLWTLLQAHLRLQAVLKDTMTTGALRVKSIQRRQALAERISSLSWRD